jgi:hypothetical protein
MLLGFKEQDGGWRVEIKGEGRRVKASEFRV